MMELEGCNSALVCVKGQQKGTKGNVYATGFGRREKVEDNFKPTVKFRKRR